ncbi:acyltransferase family protein [Kalamiella sp. sgz302252]|uniref:acyltransferase family protein n=1 Tax=Pantoea sp. sgz302252 TaxID=3341827 RepID=UPI0036D43EF7
MTAKTVSAILKRDSNNFDLMRMLAAILVIWSHAYAINNPEKLIEPVSAITGTETGGSIAVNIFFFISGLLVTNSLLTKSKTVDFLSARFFRIVPGLAVLTIVSASVIGPLVSSLSLSEYFTDPSWYKYITNNLLMSTQFNLPGVFEHNSYPGSVNGSLWTIKYEVISYSILFGFFLLKLTKNKIVSTILCLIVIVSPIAPYIQNYLPIYKNFYITILFSCFAFGALFAVHKENIRVSFFLPALFLILHLIFRGKFVFISNAFISLFFCTFALWFSTLKFIVKINIKYDISYGIYLWGFLIQQLISYFLNLNIYQSQVLAIVMAMFFGYFSSRYIEMPAMSIHKKMMQHRWLSSSEFKKTA